MAFTGSNWGRRVLLTGLSPSATLSGFVALVSLDNIPVEAIDAGGNSALNGGGDLRFSTDDAGVNQLPLEVVSFVTNASAPSRNCQLWIRFPTYASGTREVYMFYNKAGEVQPAVGASFGRNEVWQDSALVSHFEAVAAVDSTGNNTLTAGSGVSQVTDGGALGNGVLFDNTVNGKYAIPDSSIFDTLKVSITSWINLTGQSNNNSRLLGKHGQYNFVINGGEKILSELWGVSGQSTDQSQTVLSTGVTQSLNLDYDGSDVVYSIDGTEIDVISIGIGDLTNSSDGVFIGGRNAASEALNAKMYFLNIYKGTKGSEFKSSEYDNQNSPSTFWTTGTPDTPSAGGISVTEELKNINYNSLDPVITLTGALSITESLVNTNYAALNPVITLTGVISIIEQLKNANYTSLDPIIDLTGLVEITENTVNTNYAALNPAITLTAGVIEITEQVVNTQYNAINPSILLTPEPLGIVSTVCFDGVLVNIEHNGIQNEVSFNGQSINITFNGNFNEIEFNGTIQTSCNPGSIKTNC